MIDVSPEGFAQRLTQAWETACNRLEQELRHGDSGIVESRWPAGTHWFGQLSTSALSTATAISALVQCRTLGEHAGVEASALDQAIDGGCKWLWRHQNADGGFGDTDRSHSNIATTLLVLAAWKLAEFDAPVHNDASDEIPAVGKSATDRAWHYVDQQGKWDGLRRRYGKDKTFVVPILANCALAGLIEWSEVAALPFEAAWLPQDYYRLAKMPVVSYAIPALVAIGQAKFHFAPPSNPPLRWLRKKARLPTLEVLRKMQPASGGYLEAVPLTSFVLMNLAAVGNGHLPVARDCLRFLLESRLPDDSWPIDTNLATWLTSLSVRGLSRRNDWLQVVEPEPQHAKSLKLSSGHIEARTIRWLLSCQHRARHPFTGANPGGWGWTDLSGAVPDADDTPAALLALAAVDLRDEKWARLSEEVEVAVIRGLHWLCKLQNRDGGWPTFCRGWGQLPFDRSGTDLTAHALRAFEAWLPKWERLSRLASQHPSLDLPTRAQTSKAIARGFAFLERQQQADGAWLPLWFGNQDRTLEDNPVYGTGKVLLAFAAFGKHNDPLAVAAIDYLRKNQNADGGWGGGPSTLYTRGMPDATSGPVETGGQAQKGGSTIEESAVALEGLIAGAGKPAADATIMRGLQWLVEAVERGDLQWASPIGFYFAKLWYYEELYPTVFSVSALGSAIRAMDAALVEP